MRTSPPRSCTRTSTATTCGPCTRRFIPGAEPSRVPGVREGRFGRAGAPPELWAPTARRPRLRRRGGRSAARGRSSGRDRECRASHRLLLGGAEAAVPREADSGARAGRGRRAAGAAGQSLPELMPELPDIVCYLHALEARVVGQRLERLRIASPFLLRTADPPLADLSGRAIRGVRRLGKRIVFAFEDAYFVVLHLMIAGRLHWRPVAAPIPRRAGLAALDFPNGTLLLTEASTKHRASLHVVRGERALAAHDPGGLDVLGATLEQFRAALARESHTLKRALTDPRVFDGIGNAYSDEILHAAVCRRSASRRSSRSRRASGCSEPRGRRWRRGSSDWAPKRGMRSPSR